MTFLKEREELRTSCEVRWIDRRPSLSCHRRRAGREVTTITRHVIQVCRTGKYPGAPEITRFDGSYGSPLVDYFGLSENRGVHAGVFHPAVEPLRGIRRTTTSQSESGSCRAARDR